MKTRRFIKKILAVSVSALLACTAPFYAAAQAPSHEITLADYPFPFINQGQFDAKIVVGKNAAASDVIGAVDISASLQAHAVEEIPIPLPPNIPQGDAYDLTSGRNLFEFREGIRDVLTGGTIDSDELDSLKSGTINTDQGNTQYNQYLRFGSGANGDALSNWTLYYGPNDDPNEKVGDYLLIPELDLTGGMANLSQNALFEYDMEFQDGLRTKITERRDKLILKSIEQKAFNIFGQDFSLVDTTIRGSENTTDVTLSFMGGDVVDQIQQGETKVYTIDGVDYEISLVFIADPRDVQPSAKFSINGELTQQLQPGDVDVLSQGIQIGVQSVLVSGTSGMVIFFLGVNKLELRDNNTQDTLFFQGVRAGSERIDGGYVRLLGHWLETDGDQVIETGEIFKFDQLQYRFLAKAIRGTTNIYVPPSHGVREFLDRPQGMLNSNWDIKYNGLFPVKSQPIKLSPQGDNEYRLAFTNIEGLSYNVPLAEVDTSLGLRYGRSGTQDLLFVEPLAFTGNLTAAGNNLDLATHFPINRNDYFIVSNQRPTGFDPNGITHAYQYQAIDTSNKRLTLTDLSQGAITVNYHTIALDDGLLLGTGDLILNGVRHVFYIANWTNSTLQYPLAIDVDGDGLITGKKAQITTYGRGIIDITGLNFSHPNWVNQTNITQDRGSFIVNLTTASDNIDSGGPRGGENLQINISAKPDLNEIFVQGITYFRNGINYNTLPQTDFRRFKPSRGSEVKDHATAATDYGAIVDEYTPRNDVRAREVIIDYPEHQRGGQVLITGGQKKKILQAESLTTKKVNPIPVGFSVLDTDAPRVGSENMIVVGGPCANRVAAELLGNPTNCAKGFSKEKALLRLFETGDRFAVLIAGYESLETLGASYVLADFQKYGLVGREMEVIVKDLDHIVVTPIR